MPEVKKQEDPVEPFSLSGLCRSTYAQMEIYRERPAPTCAFLLALATWLAVCYRFWRPESVNPIAEGVCIFPDTVFLPNSAEWRRYLCHFLWPLELGYVRGFLSSTALLVEGYAFEYEVGTPYFAGLFTGLHIGAAIVLLHFRFTLCFISLEPAIAAIAVVMHRVNPKIHTDGLDKSIRLPFAIEPRWHMWILLSVLLLIAQDFPQVFAVQAVGLAVGGTYVLRNPEVWFDSWTAVCTRTFTVGATVHIMFFVFAILFMPLTAQTLPDDAITAIFDGRAFNLSWWQANMKSSLPMLHMATVGQVSAESFFICKMLLAFACPLLLSPFRIWARFYAGACILLVMYAMNSPEWRYPHLGFFALVYLAWAFWKLPNMGGTKWHRE